MCSRKCWKFNASYSLFTCHPFSSSSFFSFNPTTFLAPTQLWTFHVLFNHIDRLRVLFWPLVSSVKDENFQSTSVFYKAILKISFECSNTLCCILGGEFIQTLLVQSGIIHFLMWRQKTLSIVHYRLCLDLSKPYRLWRHVTLILQFGRLEQFLKKLKIEIIFRWNVTL